MKAFREVQTKILTHIVLLVALSTAKLGKKEQRYYQHSQLKKE